MAAEMENRNKFNMVTKKWNIFFIILLATIAVLVVIPMILVICISFSSESSITDVGYTFIPKEWSLQGYQYLGKMGDQILTSYMVTIFYTIAGTVMSLACMAMYAYVISLKNFRLGRVLTWLLFFTMLFNGGLVPSYILNVRYLNIGDSIWVFLLPGLVNVYQVIILRTFIRTSIPESLFEAARIDGAGHFTIFFRIVIPLFKAGLATVALFNVVNRWNDWFIGMLYIKNPDLVPLQTMLTRLQDSIEFLKQNAAISATPDGIQMLRTLPDTNLRMACTVITVLPILFAYPFFQRYFVQGLTVGSIKE